MARHFRSDARSAGPVAAALAGLTGVALGAFGAHGLQPILDEVTARLWNKAVFYHLVHAVAMLAVARHDRTLGGSGGGSKVPTGDGAVLWSFALGILLFSGSLYLMAVTHWRWPAWLTPIGGVSFLWGWLQIAVRHLRRPRRR